MGKDQDPGLTSRIRNIGGCIVAIVWLKCGCIVAVLRLYCGCSEAVV
jgi:hypothetical protein